MFKIFVCKICQLYWCFHQSIFSKTRQRDLQNCPQHPKRDMSKGDTVWWALQNRMFLGGQRDIKRWDVYDLWLCKFVEYFHVFPMSYLRRRKGPANLWSTSMSFLWVTCDAARGLQCPKETCKIWTGRKSIGDKFFQTTMTHRNTSKETQGVLGSLICLLVSHLWWS